MLSLTTTSAITKDNHYFYCNCYIGSQLRSALSQTTVKQDNRENNMAREMEEAR